jgi:CubicO group peptidase (beta-lactamase class C family)
MSKKRLTLTLTIGIILLSSFSTATEGEDFLQIENEIEQIRANALIPSIQTSIVYDGEHVWTGQFGNESKNSTYMIGSVQKILTAIAILQLHERGDIASLDDDINDYLSFKVKNSLDESTPVTFRMLLSHTSGMAETLPYQFLWDTEGIGREYGRPYNKEILAMTAEEYLRATLEENGAYYTAASWDNVPDGPYSYSPSGYTLLMYLIEKISGSNIADYMGDNIFAPLKMDSTGFVPGTNQATPYTYFKNEIEALPIWTGKYMVRSTSEDMVRLLIVLSNDGQYDGAQLLSPESIQLMRQSNPNYSYKSDLPLTRPEDFSLYMNGYGLGWIRYDSGIEGHGGSVPGFQTYFLLKEGEEGMNGIVMMMNLNAIFSTKEDAEYISSVFAKPRNLLLIKNEMLPNNPIINFIATYKIPLAIIVAILIAIMLNRKTIKKKLAA